MGRRCGFADKCHIYQGKVKLKQDNFIVRNIYCNNGERWWRKCNVFDKFNKREEITNSLVPTEGLRMD